MKTTKEQRQQLREQAAEYSGIHAVCMKAATHLVDDLEEVEKHLLTILAFLQKGTTDGCAIYPLRWLSAQELAKALGEDRVYVSPGGSGYVYLGDSQRFSWRPIEQFSGARSVLVTKWGSGRADLAYRHAGGWQTGAGPLDFEPTHYGEVPTTPRHNNDPAVPEATSPPTEDELLSRQALFAEVKRALEEDTNLHQDAEFSISREEKAKRVFGELLEGLLHTPLIRVRAFVRMASDLETINITVHTGEEPPKAPLPGEAAGEAGLQVIDITTKSTDEETP